MLGVLGLVDTPSAATITITKKNFIHNLNTFYHRFTTFQHHLSDFDYQFSNFKYLCPSIMSWKQKLNILSVTESRTVHSVEGNFDLDHIAAWKDSTAQ